jgi:competence protein ComEC
VTVSPQSRGGPDRPSGSEGADQPPRRRVDLRLVLPAVAGWLAAFVLVALPHTRWPAVAALWSCAAAGVAVTLRAQRGSRVAGRTHPEERRGLLAIGALCATAAALVATSVAVAGPLRQPEGLLEPAAANRHATATLVLTDLPVSAARPATRGGTGTPTRVRVGATMTGLRIGSPSGMPVVHRNLTVPVLAFLPGGTVAGIGATIHTAGTLSPASPEDDVAFLFFARGHPVPVGSPGWPLEQANALRAGFRDAAAALPGDGGSLLPGLAIGDTSAVPGALDDAMKASSLSHLTAVSGANCAVVVAAVLLVSSALGAPRRVRLAIALVALGGFVLLVTPQPSVLRAAVMATIVLVAFASGRPGRGIPSLALAAIVLLVGDPWLCRDYGFVLSVLATAGLLVLSGPLTTAFTRVLPRWLAAAFALPTAAQLACQPVLILLAPSIPLYGIPANLLAAPAAPVATMVGLCACLLLPIVPALGSGAAALAWVPAAWIAAVASFTAGLPFSGLPWLEGVPGMATLMAVSALFLLVAFRGRGTRIALWGGASTVVLVALVGGYAGGLVGGRIRDRLSVPVDWQYAACDVGQGDAVLVRNGDAIALVDVGPDPAPLKLCLDRFGVDRIDLLVLTHYDLDHIGGVAAVHGRADIVLVSPPGTAADARTLERLRLGGARIVPATRGRTGSLGNLGWRVLWPPDGPGGPGADAGTNAASVVLLFEGDGRCSPWCLSSIFLGDLGEDAQLSLAAQRPLPRVDVVKVAHHGSADQSGRLYRVLGASLGLLSVGSDNTYGHPTDALLRILAASGTAVARTDRSGGIAVGPGERTGDVVVWRERPG